MRWSERVRRIARTRLGQLAGAIVAAWLILFVLPRLYHLLLPVNSEFLFQEARKIAESGSTCWQSRDGDGTHRACPSCMRGR
jgi:hypothetical protein